MRSGVRSPGFSRWDVADSERDDRFRVGLLACGPPPEGGTPYLTALGGRGLAREKFDEIPQIAFREDFAEALRHA